MPQNSRGPGEECWLEVAYKYYLSLPDLVVI
jgi:hypothetical protein